MSIFLSLVRWNQKDQEINSHFRYLNWRYCPVTVPYEAICFGDISSPYIAVTQTLYKYARYLEFRFLKWPVKKNKCHFFSEIDSVIHCPRQSPCQEESLAGPTQERLDLAGRFLYRRMMAGSGTFGMEVAG